LQYWIVFYLTGGIVVKKKVLFCVIGIFILVILFGLLRGKPKVTLKNASAAEEEATPVEVMSASTQDMAATLEVTGTLKALHDVTLSAKIPGKVIQVAGREGDRISAGQIVVQLDPSDLSAQANQAQAALLGAQARLQQAITSARLQNTQVDSGINQSKAALESAKARLAIVKQGARTQERLVAQNQVESAKASMVNAKDNLDRTRKLFAQGAVAKQVLDNAELQYTISSAQYDSARQQLSLIHVGARQEEIDAAEAAVVQAREQYRMAKASNDQNAMRQDDIRAAKAAVSQAKAALAYAETQLANTAVRSPIAGTLSKRMTEPGQMAAAGTPLAQIVALNSVYFEANVSETEVSQVKNGQQTSVRIDAYPEDRFTGVVTKILPTADLQSRRFVLWIAVTNPGILRPGMFARGEVVTAHHANTLVLPKETITTRDSKSYVYVIKGDVARFQPIRTGISNARAIEVLNGLKAGDRVVTAGQDGLLDGARVVVR
jgi:HlyD family secretion protein